MYNVLDKFPSIAVYEEHLQTATLNAHTDWEKAFIFDLVKKAQLYKHKA